MVRSITFEIRWHDTQPIYSAAFQPVNGQQLRRVLDYNLGQAAGLNPDKTLASEGNPAGPSSRSSARINAPIDVAGGQNWRLATAGGDNNVRIWLVKPGIPSPAAMASAATAGMPTPAPHPPRVEYLATLTRHSGVVNCVRFSPAGDVLASAGDDGTVMLWHMTDRPAPSFGEVDEGEASFEKEHWRMVRMIRVSTQEIYDMAWSPNGETLVVGGTDFVARIINPHDGTVLREFSDHTHYVQGVAWDPNNEYIATQSSDRSVHVHTLQTSHSKPGAVGYVPPVTRNSRMDVHRRSESFNRDAKPAIRRGSSHTSRAESDTDDEHHRPPRREGFTAVRDRTARSRTPMDPPPSTSSHLNPANIGRPATPTPGSSVPQSPAFSAVSASASAHPMMPPQRTPSRRSSFSGSQAEGATSPPTSIASFVQGSASAASIYKAAVGASTTTPNGLEAVPTRRSASRTRSMRSPSPAPLPAIRPPPSPRQRMQAAQLAGGSGAAGASLLQAGMRMYGDESYSGFFRRLSFSPDGSLLVTPSGIFEAATPTSPNVAASPSKSPAGLGGSQNSGPSNASTGPRSTVYLYGRANLTRGNAPIAHLPGHKSATLVVRFSPILYELRKSHTSAFSNSEDGGGIAPHPSIPLEAGKQKSVSLNLDASRTNNHASPSPAAGSSGNGGTSISPVPPVKPISMIGLPYRMVFAVATNDVVWLYDTQQGGPLCCFSNMHYAAFTDLTWSADGQTLIMSSSDGYCSIAVFDYGELGTPYSYQDQPSLDIKAFTGAGGHPQNSGVGSSSTSASASGGASGSGSGTITVTSLPVKKKPVLTTIPSSSAPSSEGPGAPPHSQASASSGSSTSKEALPVRRSGASEAGQGTGTGTGSSTAFALGIVLEGDQHPHTTSGAGAQKGTVGPAGAGVEGDTSAGADAGAGAGAGAALLDEKAAAMAAQGEVGEGQGQGQDQEQPKKKRRIALSTATGTGTGASS
ncbi:WD40 repeat-like protein [Microstroma glucosiphilum]|uniref:WD40 repeat-like protein n=1 Tax=Pseudomicrostroma glucosiphilum TaxID=1684307 RepID=A0A316U6H4_9BASI|nr:WD40 repeat-like protein [Pseudomicrostroma glucosiphilum]PWN20418.1 WD40 repeat-like protein [Pseudomicrostroma glucosiphilum]